MSTDSSSDSDLLDGAEFLEVALGSLGDVATLVLNLGKPGASQETLLDDGRELVSSLQDVMRRADAILENAQKLAKAYGGNDDKITWQTVAMNTACDAIKDAGENIIITSNNALKDPSQLESWDAQISAVRKLASALRTLVQTEDGKLAVNHKGEEVIRLLTKVRDSEAESNSVLKAQLAKDDTKRKEEEAKLKAREELRLEEELKAAAALAKVAAANEVPEEVFEVAPVSFATPKSHDDDAASLIQKYILKKQAGPAVAATPPQDQDDFTAKVVAMEQDVASKQNSSARMMERKERRVAARHVREAEQWGSTVKKVGPGEVVLLDPNPGELHKLSAVLNWIEVDHNDPIDLDLSVIAYNDDGKKLWMISHDAIKTDDGSVVHSEHSAHEGLEGRELCDFALDVLDDDVHALYLCATTYDRDLHYRLKDITAHLVNTSGDGVPLGIWSGNTTGERCRLKFSPGSLTDEDTRAVVLAKLVRDQNHWFAMGTLKPLPCKNRSELGRETDELERADRAGAENRSIGLWRQADELAKQAKKARARTALVAWAKTENEKRKNGGPEILTPLEEAKAENARLQSEVFRAKERLASLKSSYHRKLVESKRSEEERERKLRAVRAAEEREVAEQFKHLSGLEEQIQSIVHEAFIKRRDAYLEARLGKRVKRRPSPTQRRGSPQQRTPSPRQRFRASQTASRTDQPRRTAPSSVFPPRPVWQ